MLSTSISDGRPQKQLGVTTDFPNEKSPAVQPVIKIL